MYIYIYIYNDKTRKVISLKVGVTNYPYATSNYLRFITVVSGAMYIL